MTGEWTGPDACFPPIPLALTDRSPTIRRSKFRR